MQAAETWPCGGEIENYIDRFNTFADEKTRFQKLLDPNYGVTRDQGPWYSFIREYMTSDLTVQADRLVALQGIVDVMGGYTGQSYCGGFWLNEGLPYSLLWSAQNRPLTRPTSYIAPSWSWAALDGEIKLDPPSMPVGVTMIRILGGKGSNISWYKPIGMPERHCALQLERARHEEDSRRRREETEARTQRVFEDLERGVKFQEMEEDSAEDALQPELSDVKVTEGMMFSFDAPMARSCVIHVYCLPVIRADSEIFGLLLHPAAGAANHYERLGIFRLPSTQLHQLHQLGGHEEILLI
ncbi:hypothetical protein F5B22DRAFT_648458 [Xylaria bambusicola]|uniref:uncharacterized protein n=1 Tax=Xylaria bambusicola TaxID=326684 RepID=UPI00200742D3|nr:uncharacterized protein F5B22DRAFT_648458 [Xylaria bambusicola]KAI0512606.1 hypothetical protein F5B22DRAFT_648458 [Xylaria bambusicola]